VWVFRWRNTHADGSKKENNRVIGIVLDYHTKAAAEGCGGDPDQHQQHNPTSLRSGNELR